MYDNWKLSAKVLTFLLANLDEKGHQVMRLWRALFSCCYLKLVRSLGRNGALPLTYTYIANIITTDKRSYSRLVVCPQCHFYNMSLPLTFAVFALYLQLEHAGCMSSIWVTVCAENWTRHADQYPAGEMHIICTLVVHVQ